MGADDQPAAGMAAGPNSNGPVGQGEYVVSQGECIESIAFEHGLFWKSIWDHAQNSELKQKRKDPNALLPGDRVHVREKELKQESGATEARHRFKRKGIPAILKLVFLNDAGKPRANLPYRLDIDGQVFTGSTDGDGALKHGIPPNAQSGTLTLNNQDEYLLDLRHLDPSSEATGIQARLRNLGYDPGDIDGDLGPRTKGALSEFQQDHDLDVTGEPNEQTLKKLEDVHGG